MDERGLKPPAPGLKALRSKVTDLIPAFGVVQLETADGRGLALTATTAGIDLTSLCVGQRVESLVTLVQPHVAAAPCALPGIAAALRAQGPLPVDNTHRANTSASSAFNCGCAGMATGPQTPDEPLTMRWAILSMAAASTP